MHGLGLFPINLVLFPEAIYPIHIFEERYKTLVNECAEQNKPFGINLMSQSKLHDIGCSALVYDILKRYNDGRMDILVIGKYRYRIKEFNEGLKPYYVAEVEYFDDNSDVINVELLSNAVELFNEVAGKILVPNMEKINISELNSVLPSFLIAQKAGLTPEQKQMLLESRCENDRLSILINHLKTLIPYVREVETISKIIKYDGYIRLDNYEKH